MTKGSSEAPERSVGTIVRLRTRSLLIGILAATIALTGVGCATTPGSVEPGPTTSPDTNAPEPATKSSRTAQSRPTDPKIEFHAKATDRQQFQVHIDFGRAFETQGNLDGAVLEYQDALTVVQTKRRGSFEAADEALAHRRIGSAMDRLGRFAQAETHYNKALKLSPRDPKVWNDVGYSYYLQGRWADAERALKTATRFAPDDDRVRTNLGLTLAAAGRTDEALPLLSQSNGDAIGHANLGYLLAAAGQKELARNQYEMALALRPDLEIARRALAKMDLTPAKATEKTLIAGFQYSTDRPVDQQVKTTGMRAVKIPPPSRKFEEELPPLPR
jgi:Flp pilus assembly protein TadD